ncbi:MAG: EI24 domain-containing protein [Myxococcales bacterium]|nr:EI24 domain-containing protein [Myxococcales bacterium]
MTDTPKAQKPDRATAWPDPNAGSAPRRFLAGAKAAFGGFGFVTRHPKVLIWCAAAFVLYVIVMSIVLAFAASWDERFVQALMWERGPAWWQSALYEMARAGLYVLWWIVALLASFTAALPLMAPLFAFLAEATETAFYGFPSEEQTFAVLAREMIQGVIRSLMLVVLNVFAAGFIWLVGFGLGLIFPPLGTAVAIVIGGGWAALWYGLLGMNYTFENNQTSLAKQMQVPQRIAPLLLGYGTVAHLMSYFPPFVPFIVVSATVLVCRLETHGHAELSLRLGQRRSAEQADLADTPAAS